MLSRVIRAEWSSVRREAALWALLGALLALVAYAALAGRQVVTAERWAAAAAREHEAARKADLLDELVAIGGGRPARAAADPRNPLHVGADLLSHVAALEGAPLAGVAVGMRDVLPQVIHVTTKSRRDRGEGFDTSNPARRATGPFDMAFVLVFLLPLVVLATTYDVVSGEQERGTLALVLSQPVSLATFVIGKVVLRGLVLVAVSAAAVVVGASASGTSLAAPGALPALGLLLLLVAGYVAFWLCLALAVNAWGRSSAANALSLVAAWLALTVVLPGLAAAAVDVLHPTPSRAELVNVSRSAAREASDRLSDLEGNHGRPADAAALAALDVEEEVERRMEPVTRRFREQLGRQQALVDSLRFVSPALLLHEGVAELAGSGVRRHQRFDESVERFQDELRRWFHERARRGARLDADDYAAMPHFEYHDDPARDAAGRVLASLAALAAACAALVAVALAGLRRMLSRGFR